MIILEIQYLCINSLQHTTKVKSEHLGVIDKFWCCNEPPNSTIIQTGGFLPIPVCSRFKQDEITLENHQRLRNPDYPTYYEEFWSVLWLQTGIHVHLSHCSSHTSEIMARMNLG